MRKRRNRATWFPVNPTFAGEGGSQGYTTYETDLDFPVNAQFLDSQILAVPLTLDFTPSIDAVQTSDLTLQNYVQGQDYLLQRVVGKVWGGINQEYQDNTALRSGILCIALAVLPNEAGSSGPQIDPSEYNPVFAENAQQPWIWRRTWRLDNPAIWSVDIQLELLPGSIQGYPGNTSGYHGMQEGGHLDAKSRRRITKEHRLYLVGAMQTVSGNYEDATLQSTWHFGFDLRVLGQMRRGKNKSSF